MDITLIILLAGLVISAAICVMIRNLLKAAIALAVVSAMLAIIMFVVGAHLAAVFELSVCAGLITVVFTSAISMTKIRTKDEQAQLEKERRRRFVWLPILLITVLAAILFFVWPVISGLLPYQAAALGETAQDVIWNKRQIDLMGQIVIILAGVYGVLVFFKESDEK